MEINNIFEFNNFLASQAEIKLTAEQWKVIENSYQYLHLHIEQSKNPIYGVNTGFGSLCNVQIANEELSELQRNLLITHAAGTGPFLSKELSKSMLLLKIKNILAGYSGISKELTQRLIDFYNLDLIPVVHSQGSLGASGDLAPLSELFLPLIGLGYFWAEDKQVKALPELSRRNLLPLNLQAKEALGLINGTQFMLAHALHAAKSIQKIQQKLPLIAANTLFATNARIEPFLPHIHAIRPHSGQIQVAQELFELMEQFPFEEKTHVQDLYSLRCIPQVHGASYDALNHCIQTWQTELNSVTDNPNVFSKEGLIISGGNFHGQPLALTLDYAAIAIAELASISERRTYFLISGQRNLPPYLSPKPGIDSGYMIAQYTAASLVSQNKQLCTPASVDSITSSNGQEDHVSMGANAATKLLKVIENTCHVLAIESLVSAQARTFKSGSAGPVVDDFNNAMEHNQNTHEHTPMNQLIQDAYNAIWN